jgi:hypothetical protein
VFSTVVEQLTGYFGRSFVLAAFVPTFVFTCVSLALGFEIADGLRTSFHAWDSLSGQLQAFSVVGLLIVVTLFAYLLANLQFTITRLFEGYWPRAFQSIRNWRAGFYLKKWQYLGRLAETVGTTEQNEIYAQQLAYYPPPNHLDKMMPTRLGNILRASEIYAYDRYGIDAAPIWSRLSQLLKPEETAAIEELKLTRDFMLLMCVLSASFSFVWCALLLILTRRWDLFLACAAGWPLAALFYHSAVQSSLAYAEQVRVVFDLYRARLLEAMDRPTPASPSDEQGQWLEIGRFFYRNLPLPAVQGEPHLSGLERLAAELAEAVHQFNERN